MTLPCYSSTYICNRLCVRVCVRACMHAVGWKLLANNTCGQNIMYVFKTFFSIVAPCILILSKSFYFINGCTIYRVSQEEWTKLWDSVPYVKIYRYNPKHLCPKLNSYGDKGQRKVWSFCGSTYCTWFAWRNTHTLRIVRPWLQLAQARSSLRLNM